MIDYDAELRAYNERLRPATGVEPGEHVLDIGCGAGQTTREAARAAAPGSVLGVDLSEPLLARARELTAAERLDNVTYEHGDAQVHPFALEHYDVAISRFGTMFFSDPLAAFTNIASALRRDGRLAILVWQSYERNEWAAAVDTALGAPDRSPSSTAALGPFSLAEPVATTRLLERAGFQGIRFDDIREPMFFGRDTDAALAHIRQFQSTTAALERLSPAERARALERLSEVLAVHRTDDGVVFDSRAWIITARRA